MELTESSLRRQEEMDYRSLIRQQAKEGKDVSEQGEQAGERDGLRVCEVWMPASVALQTAGENSKFPLLSDWGYDRTFNLRISKLPSGWVFVYISFCFKGAVILL